MRQTKGKLVYNPTAKRGGALRPGGALTSGGLRVPSLTVPAWAKTIIKQQGMKFFKDTVLPVILTKGQAVAKQMFMSAIGGAGKKKRAKKCRC